MKAKIAKKVCSRLKAQVISKSRKPVAKREDDMERINQAAEGLNAESTDALDYQTIEPLQFPVDAKKRGRGRPRHTS